MADFIINALEEEARTGNVTQLLDPHLLTPKKAPLYEKALAKCLVNGYVSFAPTWSWWAMFEGPLYFFYRKMKLNHDRFCLYTKPTDSCVFSACFSRSGIFYCARQEASAVRCILQPHLPICRRRRRL